MLVGAIIGGIGGALLLGHILQEIARMIFGLTEVDYLSLVPHGIVLAILLIVGTAILGFAFLIENNKLKIATITFSITVPIAVEIVDLSVRGYMVYLELAETYPTVF